MAQNQALPEPSRIAAIQTDAEVLALIRPLGWEYAQAMLGDSAVSAYQAYAGTRFAVQGGQTWFKADFDGNGRPDLLVLARRKGIPLVFCVLDSGNNRFRVVRNFYDSGRRRLPNARVVFCQGRAFLQYTDFARSRGHGGQLRQRQTRLLAYQAGGFVPYKRRPARHRIEAVDYESILAYHDVRRVLLHIGLRGEAHWLTSRQTYVQQLGETKQSLVAQLDTAAQAELSRLLNYVGFSRSRSHYRGSGLNHRPRIQLTVTYDGGRRKTICDPSGDGTPGLAWLYRYLEQLRDTQRWQEGK